MNLFSETEIAQKITRVFLIGAALLLLCYGLLFKGAILITENTSSKHRLTILAPHYFEQYENGKSGEIVIDPLVTSYDQFQLLPSKIQQEIDPEWLGVDSLHFPEDDSEFAIVAENIKGKTYYLVENIDAVEWSDGAFMLIEVILLICGLVLFFIAAIAIKNTSKKIAQPFSDLAEKLASDTGETFEQLSIEGTSTKELTQTLTAINNYRDKIELSIKREKSFTRYVSHELRTPMTVIKGCLSILKKQSNEKVDKQIHRIDGALNEMQALTQTFLLLARDDIETTNSIKLSEAYFNDQLDDLQSYIESNQCSSSVQQLEDIELSVEPILFNALLKNLLINAINSSPNGHISLFVDNKQLSIVDNGSGLNHQSRGYEGFGIGLVIVKDICDKYKWKFSLENNVDKGCTAIVKFG